MTQEDFFKRYTYDVVEDRIGGGGFGTVYKAYDNVLHHEVAIKVAEVKTSADGRKTFSLRDEVEALGHVPEHPNIANYEKSRVYSFKTPQGIFDYAVMQYYPDGNLSNAIKRGLSEERKEDVAMQLLDGIAFLHNHKVVHRDLKPSNILIVKAGERIIPLITDFGLSKATGEGDGSVFSNSFGGGTPRYSSPEQLQGNPLRFNTDLWSYGAILYELFTGEQLFTAGSGAANTAQADMEIYNKIVNGNVHSLGKMPDKWRKVAERCLVVDPTKRTKDVAELFAIIKDDADETEVEETPGDPSGLSSSEKGAGESKTEYPKTKRLLWIALGVAAVVALLVFVIKLKPKPTPTDPDTLAFGACQTVADYRAYMRSYGTNAIHYNDAKEIVDKYEADSVANAQQDFAQTQEQQIEVEKKKDEGREKITVLDQTPSSTQRPSNADTQLTAQQNYDKGKVYYDKKQYTDAESYFRKAAEQNNANAQNYLGIMYENGYGVTKDYTKAIMWYRKAAGQGNDYSQNQLGYLYSNGLGVTQDFTEAIKWYRKAAEQGNLSSQTSLGNLYHNGFGVTKDYVEAVKWYRKAAEQGYATAQFLLGFMYENGIGVTKNATTALEWYRKAAGQGYEFAQKKVSELSATSLAATQPLGLFSVSSNRKVYFAKGNLQYNSKSKTWRVASNPWDVIGDFVRDGWMDLFGWGTGEYPDNLSASNGEYSSFTDWGPKYKSGWRTLSNEEWTYVLFKRSTSSGVRYAKARVNGMNGVILLPDNWDKSTYNLKNMNKSDSNFLNNIISASTWNSSFSPYGAVFLPAAGTRIGFTSVIEVGSSGSYWSSSPDDEIGAYRVDFDDKDLDIAGWRKREEGRSVRLVHYAGN